MTVTINKGATPTSYQFFLSKGIKSYFLNNKIVIIEIPDCLMIREAKLSDTKTYSISKVHGAFTYTPKYHEDMLGIWSMEKQGDLFILNEKYKNELR